MRIIRSTSLLLALGASAVAGHVHRAVEYQHEPTTTYAIIDLPDHLSPPFNYVSEVPELHEVQDGHHFVGDQEHAHLFSPYHYKASDAGDVHIPYESIDHDAENAEHVVWYEHKDYLHFDGNHDLHSGYYTPNEHDDHAIYEVHYHHGSQDDHGSHDNHVIHVNNEHHVVHDNHDSHVNHVSHDNHESHDIHGSHDNHGSHNNHKTHVKHESHNNHESHINHEDQHVHRTEESHKSSDAHNTNGSNGNHDDHHNHNSHESHKKSDHHVKKDAHDNHNSDESHKNHDNHASHEHMDHKDHGDSHKKMGHDEHDTHAKYDFKYGVNDPKTGDVKEQWESRNGDKVTGGYSLKESDGTTRVVHYKSDKKKGFEATVHKIGYAKKVHKAHEAAEHKEQHGHIKHNQHSHDWSH